MPAETPKTDTAKTGKPCPLSKLRASLPETLKPLAPEILSLQEIACPDPVTRVLLSLVSEASK